MIGRFINADDVELVLVDPFALTDKNLYAYCDNNPVMRIDVSGRFWIEVGIIATGGIIGGIMGAFSAASTGGNVLEGAIEGCLTGMVGSASGLLMANPVMAVITAAIGGGLVDVGIQVASHYIKNKSMKSFKYNLDDLKRSIKSAAQTGLGTAIPQLGNAGKNVVDAIGTALIWAEGSVLIAATDVVVTNSRTAVKNYANSKTTSRVYGWASEETKNAFYASRTVVRR